MVGIMGEARMRTDSMNHAGGQNIGVQRCGAKGYRMQV